MKKNKLLFGSALVLGLLFSSCTDFTEPRDVFQLSPEQVQFDPQFAEGLLLKAYRLLPTSYNFNEDIASDDAVSNNPGSTITNMNTGGWDSVSNPFNRWGVSYEAFLYINTFLDYSPKVTWDWVNPRKNILFRDRLLGEAYALRAYHGFNLLQAHAGISGDQLLGYPIVTKPLSVNDNFRLPRNTYAECVNQIVSDLDAAIALLPLEWADQTGNAEFNTTTGIRNRNRINGITAKLIRSRVLLYAASPAFSASSGRTWNDAALAAANVIRDRNGFSSTVIRAADITFWNVDVPTSEVLWSSSAVTNQTQLARDNYPPSLFGAGRTNPTQDLVDSFPMRDGTPFVKTATTTVAQYLNRDTRLFSYIVFNEQIFAGSPIRMANLTANINAPAQSPNATRTGYYLKKMIRENVRIAPGVPTIAATFFYTYARYTEALLNYAEAANEAVGPDGTVGGYSARAVINAIRTRAGISSSTFINGLDQAGMRTAIRNERRLELCFEGHRFWDIRRWNDVATMKTSVSGVSIGVNNIATTVSVIEARQYKDFQIYGPVPFLELLKSSELKQNNLWQ